MWFFKTLLMPAITHFSLTAEEQSETKRCPVLEFYFIKLLK